VEKLKLLVIDDKKIIGDLFDLTMGSKGHDITWEQDQKAALDLVKSEDFDIVFLDIIMPEEDGIEVLRGIKEIKSELPVVMMTGYAVQEKKHNAAVLGASALIKKPFELEDVKKVIKDVLGVEI